MDAASKATADATGFATVARGAGDAIAKAKAELAKPVPEPQPIVRIAHVKRTLESAMSISLGNRVAGWGWLILLLRNQGLIDSPARVSIK